MNLTYFSALEVIEAYKENDLHLNLNHWNNASEQSVEPFVALLYKRMLDGVIDIGQTLSLEEIVQFCSDEYSQIMRDYLGTTVLNEYFDGIEDGLKGSELNAVKYIKENVKPTPNSDFEAEFGEDYKELHDLYKNGYKDGSVLREQLMLHNLLINKTN